MTLQSIQTIGIHILTAAVIIYASLCIFLMLMQNKMIFHPWANFDDLKAYPDFKYEDLYFKTAGGERINAWLVQCPDNPEAPLILFCHGNAGNISQFIDSALLYSKAGFSCLLFDYREYGRSTGKISEQGIYADSESAWTYLTETRKIKPEKIIIAGRSLGGAAAAYLASKKNPAGLIIESAFASIPEMAKDLYPVFPSFLCLTRLPTASFIKSTNCPVLHFHSPEDEIVPFRHAKLIEDAIAHGKKQLITLKGSHNDCYSTDEQTYLAALKAFRESMAK